MPLASGAPVTLGPQVRSMLRPPPPRPPRPPPRPPRPPPAGGGAPPCTHRVPFTSHVHRLPLASKATESPFAESVSVCVGSCAAVNVPPDAADNAAATAGALYSGLRVLRTGSTMKSCVSVGVALRYQKRPSASHV